MQNDCGSVVVTDIVLTLDVVVVIHTYFERGVSQYQPKQVQLCHFSIEDVCNVNSAVCFPSMLGLQVSHENTVHGYSMTGNVFSP